MEEEEADDYKSSRDTEKDVEYHYGFLRGGNGDESDGANVPDQPTGPPVPLFGPPAPPGPTVPPGPPAPTERRR